MRTQYCREHLTPKVADECGIPKRMYSENQRATEFCRTHLLFSFFSTDALLPLIDHLDEKVKEQAISTIENALDLGKHPLTGKFIKHKRLNKVTVISILEKAKIAIYGENIKEVKEEKKPEPAAEPAPATPAPVTEPEKAEPGAYTLADKIKAQKVIEEPAEADADGFFIIKKPPAPATVPASATPDKERIVKECLIAVLSPKVMEKVDAMIAGGKWEKTYLDFLVIVVKDGIGRKE